MYVGKRLFLKKWTDSGHQSETKLESLLHQEALAYSLNEPTPMSSSVTFGSQVELNYHALQQKQRVSELNITMEEADGPHAVTHGISRIIVLSADMTVILMVFYWNVLHSHGLSEICVKAGVGDYT